MVFDPLVCAMIQWGREGITDRLSSWLSALLVPSWIFLSWVWCHWNAKTMLVALDVPGWRGSWSRARRARRFSPKSSSFLEQKTGDNTAARFLEGSPVATVPFLRIRRWDQARLSRDSEDEADSGQEIAPHKVLSLLPVRKYHSSGFYGLACRLLLRPSLCCVSG